MDNRWFLGMILVYLFLITDSVSSFPVLIGHPCISLKKVYSYPLPILKASCLFLMLTFRSSLYVLDTSLFSNIWIAMIFSFVGFIFSLNGIIWDIYNFLMKFILHSCYLISNDLCLPCPIYVFLRSPLFLWEQGVYRKKVSKLWCTWCLRNQYSGEPKLWCLSEGLALHIHHTPTSFCCYDKLLQPLDLLEYDTVLCWLLTEVWVLPATIKEGICASTLQIWQLRSEKRSWFRVEARVTCFSSVIWRTFCCGSF